MTNTITAAIRQADAVFLGRTVKHHHRWKVS